jgi:hypothetical protein
VGDGGVTLRAGETVRLRHNFGREATVSSVAKDGTIMLCCYIAGRYQLRGPFDPADVESAAADDGGAPAAASTDATRSTRRRAG